MQNRHVLFWSQWISVYWVYFSIAAVVLLAFKTPWSIALPSAGLDPSWSLILGTAVSQRENFGTDFVFTYGPLGPASTSLILSGDYFLFIVFRLIADLYFARCLAAMMYSGGKYRLIPFAALLLTLSLNYWSGFEPFFYLFLFLAALRLLDRSWFGIIDDVILAVLVGLLSIVKYSFFPLCVLVLLLLDIHCLKSKRAPVSLVSAVTAIIFMLIYVNQDISTIPALLKSIYQMIAGYSDAMSISGSLLETWIFVLLALVWFGVLAISLNRWGALRKDIWGAGAFLLFCGIFGLIVFKAGFTRHDGHSLLSWHGLFATSFLFAMAAPRLSGGWSVNHAANITKLLLLLPIIMIAIVFAKEPAPLKSYFSISYWHQAIDRLMEGVQIIKAPAQWRANIEQRHAHARADIAKRYPLPKLTGTVDIIPSNQALIIANELVYKHRPVIQEYTTYTPYLIDLNRRFFESEKAPDNLLFAPGSIDGRWPASADGALWPLYFGRYEPTLVTPDFLFMKRRQTVVMPQLRSVGTLTATFGEKIEVPASQVPIMVHVRIRPNILGQLAGVAYKRGQIAIEAKLADGRVLTHRLIPALAEAGFLLSPYISNTSELALFSIGKLKLLASNEVVSFSIKVGRIGAWEYHSDIEVSFEIIEAMPPTSKEFTESMNEPILAIQNAKIMAAGAKSASPGFIERKGSNVYAHAPSELKLPLTSHTREISFEFGLRFGAWEEPSATDGACFQVLIADDVGNRTPLWEKCLKPTTIVAERSPQSATIQLLNTAPSVLIFVTKCEGNCNRDWTYWDMVTTNQ